MIAVTDDASRENEADIIVSAQLITETQMAFLIRYTSGIICVPLTAKRLRELGLERLQSSLHPAHFGTPFAMPVDYMHGTSSGVSAHDRTATAHALAQPDARAQDFGAPGHIFPLVEAQGGLATRQGHTEASLALMRLAGVYEVAVIGELMNDDGTMMRGALLDMFLKQHNIPLCSVQDILDATN